MAIEHEKSSWASYAAPMHFERRKVLSDDDDRIGALGILPFAMPDPDAAIAERLAADAARAVEIIRELPPEQRRRDKRSPYWIGIALGRRLGMQTTQKPERERLTALLEHMHRQALIQTAEWRDHHRNQVAIWRAVTPSA